MSRFWLKTFGQWASLQNRANSAKTPNNFATQIVVMFKKGIMDKESNIINLLDKIQAYLDKEKYDEAEIICNEILSKKGLIVENKVIVYAHLIRINEMYENHNKVIEYSMLMLEATSSDDCCVKDDYNFYCIPFNSMGLAYQNLGRYDKAIECFKEIIKINIRHKGSIQEIDDESPFYSIGHNYGILSGAKNISQKDKLKYLKKAEEYFIMCLNIDAKYVPAMLELGVIYSMLNDKRENDLYNNAFKVLFQEEEIKLPKEKILYKYCRINRHTIEALKRNKLFMNKAKNFNDPFDCLIYRGDHYKNNIVFRNMMDSIKISCFSKDKKSILMWSHYANSHQGICIGYDMDIDYIRKNNLYISKIVYGETESKYDNMLKKIFYQKNKIWKYEKEYRIISLKKQGDYIIAPLIKEIVFGLNCKENDIKKIKKAVKSEKKIKFYKIVDDIDNLSNIKIENI